MNQAPLEKGALPGAELGHPLILENVNKHNNLSRLKITGRFEEGNFDHGAVLARAAAQGSILLKVSAPVGWPCSAAISF